MPLSYYLNRALPLLAVPTLFYLHDTYLTFFQGPQNPRSLSYTTTRTIAIFSFAEHKEWRFLRPLVPVLHLLAARLLISLYGRSIPSHFSRNTGLGMKRAHIVLLTLLSVLLPST